MLYLDCCCWLVFKVTMERQAISAAFKLCGHAILENKTAIFSE